MRYAPERIFTAAQRPQTAAATGRHAAAGHPTPHTHRRAPCHHSHPPPATACRRQGLAFGRRRSPPKTCEPAGGAAGSAHLRTSRGSRQSRQQRRARPRQHAASKRLRGGRTGSHLSQGSRPACPAPLPARAGPSPSFTTSSSAIWQRSAPAPPFRMKTIEPADRTCTVTSGKGVVGGYLESPAHLGQPFGHASGNGRRKFLAG